MTNHKLELSHLPFKIRNECLSLADAFLASLTIIQFYQQSCVNVINCVERVPESKPLLQSQNKLDRPGHSALFSCVIAGSFSVVIYLADLHKIVLFKYH